MTAKEKLRAKVGILSACGCSLSYMAFSPVIASLAAAFPDTDISLVQMVMTLPSLMFIVFSPLSGKLMDIFSKKKLVLFSLLLYLIGGMFPYLFHSSIWPVLAGSVILGCGGGMLMPLLNAVIVDNFEQDERGQLMGLNATFVALGALLFIFVSGQLVSHFGWQSCFLAFALVLPVIVMVWLFLPPDVRDKQAAGGGKGGHLELSGFTISLFLVGFVYFVMQNAFNTNSSLLLQEMGIADAAVASAITMGNTLGGICGGAIFGNLVRRVQDQMATVALTLAAAGFLLTFAVRLFIPVMCGSVLVGVAFAFYNAVGTYLLSKYVRPENNGITVAMYIGFINLGAALSPVVVNTISGTFSDTIVSRYLVCGVVIAACGVYSLLLHRSHSAKHP